MMLASQVAIWYASLFFIAALCMRDKWKIIYFHTLLKSLYMDVSNDLSLSLALRPSNTSLCKVEKVSCNSTEAASNATK